LYHADWSASPDEEFESRDKWGFVGGEFVWTGFDYLGEPTPLDSVASSSYFGILDIAGLKKDRFYLYQSYWRPDYPMAHLLPHWTWPERVGQVTPVHVYTSGDSAELFVSGVSQGRKSKGQYEYRLRWDDVVYEPGELTVVAYRNGAEWARDSVATAAAASQLSLAPDRTRIAADGRDLCFVTLSVLDGESRLVPRATDAVTFAVAGAGELVATSNGDATNRVVFSSARRSAFSGKAVAIVRALPGQTGEIVITATAAGLAAARLSITAE
jgi:beta-galactosidase